jgi:hypothetical protein
MEFPTLADGNRRETHGGAEVLPGEDDAATRLNPSLGRDVDAAGAPRAQVHAAAEEEEHPGEEEDEEGGEEEADEDAAVPDKFSNLHIDGGKPPRRKSIALASRSVTCSRVLALLSLNSCE